MSAPRTPAEPDGAGGSASRVSWKAIVALALAVIALFTTDIIPLIIAAVSVVFAVLARRELEREPGLIAGRLWIAAVIIAGFVIVSQALFVALPFFMAIF